MAHAPILNKQDIIDSHIILGDILDKHSINRLIFLFNSGLISNYVNEERRASHLINMDVEIKSEVYGINHNNTSLFLIVRKNNEDFIHLTIHLAPDWLSSGLKDKGVIHIVKDVYNKSIHGKKQYLLSAIYYLEHPINKPDSLTFTIAYGHPTPSYPTATPEYISDIAKYDKEVEEEMDVITRVLNKLFDEDNVEFYIGNYHKKYLIQNNNHNIQQSIDVTDNINSILNKLNNKKYTIQNNNYKNIQQSFEINHQINSVLNNINTRTKYIKRKNIGHHMFKKYPNHEAMNLLSRKNRNKKKTNTRKQILYKNKK